MLAVRDSPSRTPSGPVTATVDGPQGPVHGAAVVTELLIDGTVEEKMFAPGCGEFRTKAADELVTVALALPIDAAGGALHGRAGSALRRRTGRLRRGRRRTLVDRRLPRPADALGQVGA